jgi:hypothetical protein
MSNDTTMQYDSAADAALADPSTVNLDSPDSSVTPPLDGTQNAGEDASIPVWNGAEYALDVNGQKIIPKNKDELVSWARKGRDYSQRMNEFKTQEQQFQQRAAKVAELEKLASAFEKNPDLQSRLMAMYQETLQKAQQPVVDAAGNQVPLPPEVKAKLDQVDSIAKEFEKIKEEREDSALELEIQTLKTKHASDDWAADAGEGTLLDRILKTAHKYALTDLEDAYKLCTYDTVKTNTEVEVKKSLAAQREQEHKAGIVSGASTGNRQSAPGYDPRKGDWRDAANAALADTTLMK